MLALHLAASRGHLNVVRTLLAAGTSPTQKMIITSSSGTVTRLDAAELAARHGRVLCWRTLRRAKGANGMGKYNKSGKASVQRKLS